MNSKIGQFNLWGLLNWIAIMVSSYFQIAQFLWKRTFEEYSIYAHFFRIVKILWTSLHNFCSNLSSNVRSQYHNFMLYCEVFRNSINQNSKVSIFTYWFLTSQIFLKHSFTYFRRLTGARRNNDEPISLYMKLNNWIFI